MIKFIGFLGGLFIALSLLSPLLYMYFNIPLYILITIIFVLILSGFFMTSFSIWWLSDVYSIKGVPAELIIIILSLIAFSVSLALTVYIFFTIRLSIYLVPLFFSVVTFFVFIYFLLRMFKKIFDHTGIYLFFISAKFLLYSIIFFPIFVLISLGIFSIFYGNGERSFEFYTYYKYAKIGLSILFSIFLSFSMVIVSFIFLGLGFLMVDSKKEREKILEETKEKLENF